MALRSRALAVAAVAAFSGVALSSCGLRSPRQEPAPDLTVADVLYLTELRPADVELKTPDASVDYTRAGRDTCASLEKSKSVPAVAKPLASSFYPDEASVIIVAAIHNYCPQHVGLLALPGRA
ncbi:DUF732 domain-containing protein [Actinokineospora cianjurensis]|uniref:Uncharacterized protein DUF732 n=1 Tax=Actinokineospora cianjurensis TaxID=585224 RepID=A0A421AXE4_9PSEU|nr:DUF732 domain-containing protein [Actinokineospora cianjurensis]RLK54461.1 uncharacterized protein DUF732 [Actinokineospora cianjurensis]